MNAELARQHAHYTAVKKRLATIPPVKTLEPRRWLGRELHTQHDSHLWDWRCHVYEREITAAIESKPRKILGEVAQKRGLPAELILSRVRKEPFVHARYELCWRLRQETAWTLQLIARFVGWQDHTTVMHGIRAFQRRLDEGNEHV